MNQEILEARHTHQEIVRKYNLLASVYDVFGILMESKARKRALEMASIQNGERVLEVAFGTGLNLVEILKQNPKGWVDGIDVSEKMLEKTLKRISKTGNKNYTLHLGDCRHLPFETGTFDVLMNQYLLDILPVEDFLPLLDEFYRVLKPAGRLVLVHMTRGEKWLNQIYVGLYKLKPPLLAGCRGVLSRPFLEKIGLKDIRREFISQFGFPSEVIQGIKR